MVSNNHTNVPNMPTVSYDTVKVKARARRIYARTLEPDMLILDVQGAELEVCAVSALHCQKRLLFSRM